MRELNITTREEGQRLDKILSKYLNKAPKSFVYKMLRKKNIKLNGKKATGNEKLSQGDQVCIYLAEDTINKFREEVKAGKQKIKLDVLYEDENVIMVNKPWGILSQKSKPEDISINDQIIPYAVNQGLISEKELQVVKPSICNRLDRNTTGIIICGISIEGLQTMAEMLKHRDMEKYYLCIVKGKLERTQKVSAYLKKDEKTNKVKVSKQEIAGASHIETAYEPVISNDEFTLLKVELITGKTHQIRAHLASIGHPLIGDFKYGDKKINQEMKQRFGLKDQLLHCTEIVFPRDMKTCIVMAEDKWNVKGLRGSVLEELINYTNEKYRQQKLALVQKIPTSIKPVRFDKTKRHITLAYFDQKSTVDYIGVVQGIPICFDAKECAKDIFPLQNIHEHQVEFMRQYEEQGGISFLLIYFTSRHVCYYMSFQEMMKYWNRAKEGGVKHFKYEELDIGFFVPLKQGMILHYLECLQKVLEQKDQ